MSQPSSIPVPTMRALIVASCPSNSGKGTLTYHIGCTANKEIYFRVTGRDAAGDLFSPECDLLSMAERLSGHDDLFNQTKPKSHSFDGFHKHLSGKTLYHSTSSIL